MKVVTTCSAGLLSCSMFGSQAAYADSLALDQLQTDELRLVYQDPNQTYLSPHAARSLINSLLFQEKIYHWKPYEEVTVVLTDFTDYANGSAGVSPRNLVSLEVSPANHTFETFVTSDRFYSLANHELTHIATLDAWNQRDRFWRRFFGGKPWVTNEHPETILYNYLTTPRDSTPRWYTEGSAVFMETWMSGGIGRAQGGYDEMVFRAMVRDAAHFYRPLGLVSEGTEIDFQTTTNAYLYGTRFFSYLALVYSPERVIQWLSRDEQSDRYYGDQFARVFGKPLATAWDEWIAWEHGFQEANLKQVRQFPLTVGHRVSSVALGSISKSYVDEADGTMIGGFQYPGVVPHIGKVSLADGHLTRLVDLKGSRKFQVASTAFDPATRTFFYTSDNIAYRDLMALDLGSGSVRMLQRDSRIGDLAFNKADRSLWGVRHENGYATVVRCPFPYKDWKQVKEPAYGQVFYDLDISPDGKLLSATVEEIDGRKFLRVFAIDALSKGVFEPLAQFDFGVAMPEGFVFSPDGRFLYGSSYYTGVSNIFRFEIASNKIEAVTNAETGFFRPIPRPDGTLLALEYTGTGFVPMMLNPVPLPDVGAITFLGNEIVRQHPVVKSWQVGSPAAVPLDSMTTNKGKYVPLHEMRTDNRYPILEGYLGTAALGWQFGFADPLHLYNLSVATSYSITGDVPSSEKFHANVDFKALNWHAQYWHNLADFYDLFGPTKRSRKGDALSLGYKKSLILDDPRRLDFSAKVSKFTGLDTLPSNQNVASNVSELESAEVGLEFSNARRSQASVDHEKGYDWSVFMTVDHTIEGTVPKYYGTFDFGFALPLKNSSIWLYNAAGSANGESSNSLANFYFGGFQNNYVDNREVKRYRLPQTFPGFDIDAVGGQRFFKSVLEWNAPPIRFEAVGSPGFYLSYIRPAVFVGALTVDHSLAGGRRTYTNAGLQLDFNISVLNHLPMTMSLGYARGFEHGDKVGEEWLFSLKVR